MDHAEEHFFLTEEDHFYSSVQSHTGRKELVILLLPVKTEKEILAFSGTTGTHCETLAKGNLLCQGLNILFAPDLKFLHFCLEGSM